MAQAAGPIGLKVHVLPDVRYFPVTEVCLGKK